MWRDTDVDLDQLLASSHPIRTRAELWRGGEYLGSAPVLGGSLTEKADQLVSGTLDLDVSAVDPDGRSWVPTSPLDPLNSYGQRCRLSYDVGRADGSWVPVGLGWFILDEWDEADGVVAVSALDVTDALRTARLLAPMAPKAGGTFVTELRRLVGGRLPLDTSGAPTDRAVPSGMSWQESRIDAIDELLTAWPARAELDADGVLVILPDDLDEQAPDVALVEGGGTVIKARRAGSRDGLANVVVARAADTADPNVPPVVGYAFDLDPNSPTYAEGPMGQLVDYFSSPLLRTRAQCEAAARTILRRSLRPASTIPVTCLPDPRLGVNSRVELRRRDGSVLQTVAVSVALPLTGDGGAMQLELGVIPDA